MHGVTPNAEPNGDQHTRPYDDRVFRISLVRLAEKSIRSTIGMQGFEIISLALAA
jgi:hypothetical protein